MHWTLKRTDNNETIKLHAQYLWIDEYEWTALAQSEPVYTLTGAMDIQQGIKKAGRPITLDPTYASILRSDLKKLQTWSEVAELQMQLTHPKGQTHQVIFARPAISDIQTFLHMKPIDEEANDLYQAKLHFLTI